MSQPEKQKIAIHIIIIIVLSIPMTFLWYVVINANSEVAYKNEAVTATEPCVYVTEYGERYHSASCSYLSKSKRAVGLQEAISNGYTACERCGGEPSGTITVTRTNHVATNEEIKKLGGAIALSVVSAPIVYLFIYLLLISVILK